MLVCLHSSSIVQLSDWFFVYFGGPNRNRGRGGIGTDSSMFKFAFGVFSTLDRLSIEEAGVNFTESKHCLKRGERGNCHLIYLSKDE